MNFIDDFFLEKAIKSSIMAGKAIIDIYNSGFNVNLKPDKSPITEADREAHEIICKDLANTGIPVISEEGNLGNFNERKDWEYFWLVDPLDGTKEFVNRNGDFTVNIALIRNDAPVLGIIYAPVEDVLYFASEKTGSYKLNSAKSFINDMALEKVIKSADKLPYEKSSGVFKIVASRSHLNKETTDYIENIKQSHPQAEIVSRGSSLKLCLLAEGKAELYPRFGTTMEWDIAAGHAIVKFSGGKVLQAGKDEELKYNKPDLRNPHFIASR